MPEPLDRAAGEPLELADYQVDFQDHFWQIDGAGFWKLERQQSFQEPGDESWEAFARGDWEEALRLLAARRAEIAADVRRSDEHGFAIHRVRVVAEPLTPYLQWELHLLRLREQCGTGVRVVEPAEVAPLETKEPLPEVNVLGDRVMYEILYDEDGILAGGRRFTDRALIGRWREFIAELYAAGKPLSDYFDRHVADLPAPSSQPAT